MITLAKASDVSASHRKPHKPSTSDLFKAIRGKHEEYMEAEFAYDEARDDMWFLRNNYLDTLQDVFGMLAR